MNSINRDKIIYFRKQRKLSKANLCRLTGIDYANYCNFEKGKRSLSLENVIKLADYYNCSVDFLLNRCKTSGNIDCKDCICYTLRSNFDLSDKFLNISENFLGGNSYD